MESAKALERDAAAMSRLRQRNVRMRDIAYAFQKSVAGGVGAQWRLNAGASMPPAGARCPAEPETGEVPEARAAEPRGEAQEEGVRPSREN